MWKKHLSRLAGTQRQAFTLVETMCVVLVVAVLVGLALPLLSRVRSKGDGVRVLANLREIGTALTMYADSSRDGVPVFFRPLPALMPRDEPQRVDLDGTPAIGHWFDHSFLYHAALRPALPFTTISVPGRPIDDAATSTLGTLFADLQLSESFYATPEFWRSSRNQSPIGLRQQRWSDLLFPSDKGVVSQRTAYRDPRVQHRQLMTTNTRAESGVLWGDMSAAQVRQGLLNPGVPNTLDHTASPGNPSDSAMPVIRTRGGTRGRDR